MSVSMMRVTNVFESDVCEGSTAFHSIFSFVDVFFICLDLLFLVSSFPLFLDRQTRMDLRSLSSCQTVF